MSRYLKRLALLLLVALTGIANAGPLITYKLELSIESIPLRDTCDTRYGGAVSFGCLLAIGDVYSGSFQIDSDILSTDGIDRSAAIYNFSLPFGQALYSTGSDNVTLSGFRNGGDFAAAPGFLIIGGELVDLVGGVYAAGDAPFIDFYDPRFGSSFPRNSFSALDGHTRANGTLLVSRVSEPFTVHEPSTLALTGLILGGLIFTRRRTLT